MEKNKSEKGKRRYCISLMLVRILNPWLITLLKKDYLVYQPKLLSISRNLGYSLEKHLKELSYFSSHFFIVIPLFTFFNSFVTSSSHAVMEYRMKSHLALALFMGCSMDSIPYLFSFISRLSWFEMRVKLEIPYFFIIFSPTSLMSPFGNISNSSFSDFFLHY